MRKLAMIALGAPGQIVSVQGGRRSNARKQFAHCERCGCRRAVGHKNCRPALLTIEGPAFTLESVLGDGHA